jgi:hypothetical protein
MLSVTCSESLNKTATQQMDDDEIQERVRKIQEKLRRMQGKSEGEVS